MLEVVAVFQRIHLKYFWAPHTKIFSLTSETVSFKGPRKLAVTTKEFLLKQTNYIEHVVA
jgi:hypothetical protein